MRKQIGPGGVNLATLQGAEAHSLGWHQHWKNNAAGGADVRLFKEGVDTSNGLAKIPYLRDIRRSIGIGGFFLQDQIIFQQPGSVVGTQARDSLGMGLYAVDFHPIKGCSSPSHLLKQKEKPVPFTLPFLAHTSETFDNLLVAGKAMAQTYFVNAATRLQPIEWSSGWGAGVAMANMWRFNASSLSVGHAYLPNPQQFKQQHESESAFAQRLDRSSYLMQQIQFEVTDNQPIWFCNSVGLNGRCLTSFGRYRLDMPAQ